MKKGLLLLNLGTPDGYDLKAVKRYLREFLSDKRVLVLPPLLRYLFLHSLLPLRLKKTAKAYRAIWDKAGSPLLVHSLNLQLKLQEKLQGSYQVALGMRYGNPSIANALTSLKDCEHLYILPLFPQYSSAATGSAIEEVLTQLAAKAVFPSLSLIRDFYANPAFISAQAALIKPHLNHYDYFLFSYHGLPLHHLSHIGCQSVCENACPSPKDANPSCYKAQCHETTRALAKQLNLKEGQYGTAFQSRLGRMAWLGPYIENTLEQLALREVKRLAITCPSFAIDCLETLEEIGLRAKAQWQKLGGLAFTLIPCVNDSEAWLEGLCSLLQKNAS